MTGPDHYREAEEHLDAAAGAPPGSSTEHYHLAAAQARAVLALAAGTWYAASGEKIEDVA